jgi:signal transduction histidine kinase
MAEATAFLEPAGRRGAARFKTRFRLLVAAGTVAVMLVAAVGVQVAALRGIEHERAAAEELEERLLVAVQLESALRRQFAHQPHAASGHPLHAAAYRDARRSVTALTETLVASLREPDAIAWVAAVERASAELDRATGLRRAAHGSPIAVAMAPDEEPTPLAFEVEQNVSRLFSMLGIATANHREAVIRGQDAIHRLAIGLVLGTALLTVLLTLYLSRSVAMPLARLEDGVARMAGGHLDTRIDIRSHDEFGAVADQLNEVAERLQEHRERLTRAEALAAVGRSTAGVVHELNNSLQVMLGYATLDRDAVAGELASHLQRIEHEARRSTEIVSGVLQMARSPEAVAFAPVDLREVAEDVASAARLLGSTGGPEISVAGSGVALGTRCRYHQILSNLVKNAADAAGPSGRVRISISPTETATEIAVEDSGAGVPAAVAGRIFEPFFTTKPGGTGLGLPVCRSIAAGLGGTIEVARGELGGARFTVRVPRRKEEV